MVYARTSIPDFSLANAFYAAATVTAYEVDVDGAQTTTLAPLYEQPVGTARLTNPQTLDSEGKFVRPVYIDRNVMLIVTGRTVSTHGTGVITVPVFTDCLMDTYTGTGAQTVFTLSREAYVATFLEVTVDGATQQPDTAYTVFGTSLTFTEAPPYAAQIFVIHSVTAATAQTGPPGPGVPTGGTTGQALTKVSGTAFDTQWSTINPTLGGDLSGTASAATVTKLQNIAVSTADPTLSQILRYDGTSWTPSEASLSSSVLTGDSSKFTDGRNGILLPFYVYPNNPYSDAVVAALLALIRTYHTVPVVVVINPSSGPGAGPADGNYTAFIRVLEAAGAKTVGYVSTAYATRAEADVLADIDLWLSLYPGISGIFLDEQPYDLTVGPIDTVALYASYTSYAHSHSLWPVVANPGTNQQGAHFATRTADIIVVNETGSWPSESDMLGNFTGGHVDYSYTLRAALVYAQATLDVDLLRTLAKYVQYVYITNDVLSPNPWDSVSTLLEAQMKVLADIYDEALGGDLSGTTDSATVTKIRGISVSATTPTSNQILQISGSTWTPTTLAVTLAGDVTGGYAANTVVKLQNRTVAATSPSDLQYLGWNNGASQWEPKTITATTSVTMTGDVSGNSATNSVDKIKAVTVSATAPTTGQTLTYSGSAWAPATPYAGYDIPVFIPDRPTSSMLCCRIAAVRNFDLPASLTGSVASAGVAATGSTVFTIYKGASSIGTVTFAPAGTTGTFSFASLVSFTSADLLRIVAPASVDATLADISISLLGSRT